VGGRRQGRRNKVRIGIDARFLTHPQRGGFKAYTHSVVAALALVDRENSYILYTDRECAEDLALPSNFKVKPVHGIHPIIREQALLPAAMSRDGVHLAHYLCNTAPVFPLVPMAVTIHDTIPLRPGKFEGGQDLHTRMLHMYWKSVMPVAARKSVVVITNSDYVLRDLGGMFALPSYRFCVVPLEVNPVFSPGAFGTPPCGVPPGGRYIMAFASRDGRKNHQTAMDAHAMLLPKFPDLKLVLVCSHPGVKEKVEGGDGVLPVGPVSTEELIWLYRNACALMFPSFDEGFGLPPVEAMACGTPVIASNAGSLPEVTGGCACLADPLDAKGFAEGIRLVLEDDAVRDKMVEMGLLHVKRYSRESMGRELVAAYQRVVTERKRH